MFRKYKNKILYNTKYINHEKEIIMANDELLQLHRQHQTSQDKYTYFLLAITASAIAFAIQKSDTLSITYSLIPLGLAVLLWGFSFYFGIKNLLGVQSAIYANFNLLQLKKGIHTDQPDHPQMLEAALRGVESAIKINIENAQFYGVRQFRLIISGGVFFLVWHILEMILRTY